MDGNIVHDIDEQAPSLDFLKGPEAVTQRERDVIACVARGMRNLDVARVLAISPHTVRHHITHIRRKLGLRIRREMIEYAVRTGLGGMITNEERRRG